MAQSGLWDVDGTGLQPVEDPNLARALLQRVNDLNVRVGVQVAVPVALFALLPQSAASHLVTCVLVGAALHLFGDKNEKAKN